jgi:predicted nucleotidyltransferase
MRRDGVIRLLAERRNELASRFGVRELALFGSVARDLAGTESDVDFLVEFGPPRLAIVTWT